MVKVPVILILAGFIIVVAGMKAASSILVPFFLAVFIAVICAPPLFWLQRKGVPKVIALVLILVGILFVGMLFGALIGPPLDHFLRSLPGYQERLSTYIGTLIGWLHEKGINIPADEVPRTFNPGWVMSLAGGIFSALSSVLTNAFLILLTVVFILLEAADLPKKLRMVLKNPERSLSTIEKFSQNAKRYLVIKTLISAAVGLVIWLWLSDPRGRLSGALGNALVSAELRAYYRRNPCRPARRPSRPRPVRGGVCPSHRPWLCRRACCCGEYHRTETDGQRPEFIDARCLPFIGLLGMGSGAGRHDPLGAHDQPCQDRP